MTNPFPTQKRLLQASLFDVASAQGDSVAVASVLDHALGADLAHHDGAVFHTGATPRASARRSLYELEAEGLVVRDGRGIVRFKVAGLVDTVLEGDAWRILPMIPDQAVPAVIADPPWTHLREHKAHGTKTRLASQGWFAERDLDENLIGEFWRVLKPGGFFACYMPPFQRTSLDIWIRVLEAARAAGFVAVREVTWRKNRSMGYRFTSETEPILVWARPLPDGSLPECPDKCATDYIEAPAPRGDARTPYRDFGPVEEAQWAAAEAQYGSRGNIPREVKQELPGQYHDTEKPVAVPNHLLRVMAVPGEILLDVFAGTGGASIAAVEAGMRFCAIEASARTVEFCLAPRLGAHVARVVDLSTEAGSA